MITLADPFFWINFLYFFIAVFFAFFIPGDLFISKIKNLPFSSRVILATILGMALGVWQGMIFGYLGMRYLSYIYLFVLFLFWIKTNFYEQNKLTLSYIKSKMIKMDLIIVVLIILGVIVQLAPVWGFGLKFDKGLFLCCGNREDLIFHYALSSSIMKSFPPQEPGMTGVLVQNYHYFSNLVSAELARVFRLPLLYTQFQYVLFFISLMYGLSGIILGSIFKLSKVFTRWLVFLLYFGGDAIYIFLLVLGRDLTLFKTVSSLEDASTFLINPPRAFSIVLLFGTIALIHVWIRNKNYFAGILAIFISASLVGFKVYTAIFAALGIFGLIIYFLWNRQYRNIIISMVFLPIAAIIYLPINSQAGGLFWAPFNISGNFIVQPAFGLIRWELARQIYREHNNFLRVLQFDLGFLIIFLLAISGTKIIGLFQSIKSYMRLSLPVLVYLLFGTLGSLFLGTFFLQKSGGANTFNFIVSYWIVLSIPAALSLEYWQRRFKGLIKILFIVTIIILTIPRVALNTYSNLSEYSKLGFFFLDNNELEGYKYLRSVLTDKDIVVVDPKNDFDNDSPYVSGFIGASTYLSGIQILESHGIKTDDRSMIRKTIFTTSDEKDLAANLLGNKINYLILWERSSLPATGSAYFLEKVFSNKKMTILKTDETRIKEYIKLKLP